MSKKFKYYLFIISMLTVACARFAAPGGGPDDTTPPVIIWDMSDSNYQTNFDQDKIRLEFNEWVTVTNPLKEIVISPPLSKPFVVGTKGKSVVFEFPENEELKPDVTYQINFGNAIKDFSAGNALVNQVFVFSTGDIIDSLAIAGKVLDELTGEPVQDATVLVYSEMSDSVVYLQRPFYFCKTDKQGKFQINNMRADTFQVYAILDNNVSYTYDLPGEKVAFYDRLINTLDTTNNEIELLLFDEEEDLRLVDYRHDNRGIYKIIYDRKPSEYNVSLSRGDIAYVHEVLRDTIFLYHNSSSQDSFDIYISVDGNTDTLKHKRARKELRTSSIKIFDARTDKIEFHAEDSVVVEMNKPIGAIDTSLIQLTDTLGNDMLVSAGFDVRNIYFNLKAQPESVYELTILPEALLSLNSETNSDTISLMLQTFDPSKFGRIGIKVDSLQSGNYIAQLLSSNNVIREMVIDTSYLEFERMKAGSYQLKIIEDTNSDGRWSPGDLYERKRSERQGTLTLEDLKEGWDLELTVNLKSILDGT